MVGENYSWFERAIRRIDPILGVAGLNASSIIAAMFSFGTYLLGEYSGYLGPVSTTFLLWLGLGLLLLALSPGMRSRRSLWPLSLLLILAALLSIVASCQYLKRNYWDYRPRATAHELRQNYIENRSFYLHEFPMADDFTIYNKTIENCTILGPVTMAQAGEVPCVLDNINLGTSTIEDKAFLFEIDPSRKTYAGAVGLNSVVIRNSSIPVAGFLMSRAEFDHHVSAGHFRFSDVANKPNFDPGVVDQ